MTLAVRSKAEVNVSNTSEAGSLGVDQERTYHTNKVPHGESKRYRHFLA